MIRLAHYSDIHLTQRSLGWTVRDLVSKKVPGWVNVKLLGRGRRFRHAPRIAELLMNDLASRGFDHVVFSGDATTLAFPREFQLAAKAMRVGMPSQPPTFAVPGNHDYYTRSGVDAKLFETHFAPALQGERLSDDTYPFARKVGSLWLIGVNSCTANGSLWDASGAIGDDQLERLERLCATLSPGPRILVTHYPLRNANGHVEHSTHRLRDHAQAIASATLAGISLWLHGHIHRGFVLLPTPEIPFPVICAGSCTQTNRWMYNEYEISGDALTMLRRRFDPITNAYQDAERETIPLRKSPR